jgi:hypothetical protein
MTIPSLLPSLTEAELDFIANLDYGSDRERHLAALRKVIARGGNVRMEEEIWHPYEVIELGKNDLKPGHEREFAACLIIVFLNILSGTDKMNDVFAILDAQKENTASLPASLREPAISLAEKIKK